VFPETEINLQNTSVLVEKSKKTKKNVENTSALVGKSKKNVEKS
jgi:hypothetical protein